MLIIVVLSLLAVSTADVEHACCAPSPYSGVLLEVGGSQTVGTTTVEFSDQVLDIQYDYDKKIILVVAKSFDTKTEATYTTHIWDDYENGTRHILAADNKCYSQTIDPNTMQAPCVAGNLTFVGTTIVGAGSHGVPVWMWSGQDAQGRLSISVTNDGECTPVSLTRYGQFGNKRSLTAYLFTNVQKMNNHLTITLPSQCANATAIPSSKRSLETLTGVRHPF